MNYWGFKPLYRQIAELLQIFPKMTRKEALGKCKSRTAFGRTNPPRPRFSGTQEMARRKMQIEKGFKQVRV